MRLFASRAKPSDPQGSWKLKAPAHAQTWHSPPLGGEAQGSAIGLPLRAAPSHDFERIPVLPGSAAIQAKLTVNAPGDRYEHEADRVADRVMRMAGAGAEHPCSCGGRCDKCKKAGLVQASGLHDHALGTVVAPPAVEQALRAPGRPLDPAARSFMEPRFGHDFAHVRVHSEREGAASAEMIGARAYTVGGHIVFGAGEYAPGNVSGRSLLAHELAHVVQQTGGGSGGAAAGVVQRQPTIEIMGADVIGRPSATQRRAAASTTITCCDQPLGTLHAMPLFSVSGGVGSAIHFIAAGAPLEADDPCHCDDHRIIQIIQTTHPLGGRDGAGYVDNAGRSTPFYGDVFLSGRGEHEIPSPAGHTPFPDAGERVETTESIYDQPTRSTATRTSSIRWTAESCVACVNNTGPDRILGCVTYGFSRNYNTTTSTFDPVVPIAPGSRAAPSAHFIDTLGSDSTTSSYDFRGPPGFIECHEVGDFPLPRGDTRIA